MVVSVLLAAPGAAVVSCSEGWRWTQCRAPSAQLLPARPSAQECVAKTLIDPGCGSRGLENLVLPSGFVSWMCGYAIKTLFH